MRDDGSRVFLRFSRGSADREYTAWRTIVTAQSVAIVVVVVVAVSRESGASALREASRDEENGGRRERRINDDSTILYRIFTREEVVFVAESKSENSFQTRAPRLFLSRERRSARETGLAYPCEIFG